jgi:hypothetical protein
MGTRERTGTSGCQVREAGLPASAKAFIKSDGVRVRKERGLLATRTIGFEEVSCACGRANGIGQISLAAPAHSAGVSARAGLPRQSGARDAPARPDLAHDHGFLAGSAC